MKNKWMQYLSFALCVVMMIIIIVQGKKLEEYQTQVNGQMQSLRMSLNDDIQSLRYYIDNQMEKADKVVSSYELTPSGIDKNTHFLKVAVSLSLKEWYEDSKVELIATLNQTKIEVGMNSDGAGGFRGEISLPLEGDTPIYLSAQISGGGMIRKEDIGGWGNLSMLLPLQNSGGGWSGPEYRDGVMSSQFSISIRGFNGEMLRVYEEQGVPTSVQNPEFHIYKNGELAQRIPAIASSAEDNLRIAAGLEPEARVEISEITYSVGTDWNIECEVGDVIDIHFVCRDNYGLGYDFYVQSWKVESETQDNFGAGGFSSGYDGSETLKLFWE